MSTFRELLQNKKIVFYGDSITHNWEKYTHEYELTHKEDPNYQYGLGYGHVKMLNDECHFKSVDNFAVSGGCYANCSKIAPSRLPFRHFPYQVTHSIDKLKEAEVVFVMFGTNDFSEQVDFGKYDDVASSDANDNMTFYEGMNYGFNLIKKVNPNAEIMVVNCLNRTAPIETTTRPFTYSLNEYNLAIALACRIHKCHLIDVSNLFNLCENFPGGKGVTYTNDGLHPNEEGYKALTKFILDYEVK